MTCLLHPKILLYPSSSFSVFLAVVITNKSPSSIFNHLRVINFISFKRSDDCLFQVSFLHVQLFICNLFYKVFTSCIWQLMLETSKQISKTTKNATRSNNRDDLLYVSFTLKMSIFLEAYTYPNRKSMMELLLRK